MVDDRSDRDDFDRSEQLDYWLRRAEQESIAAIRSTNSIASQRHDAMAQAYSAMARTILGTEPNRQGAP
jgi:hypothetical protein